MFRQWGTARFEELMEQRSELYEQIKEKEQELEQMGQESEEPAFFENIEHYYEYTDNEESRTKQREQLRQRINELKLSLFTGSNDDKGIARKVKDHLVMLSVSRNEDDYQRVKERLFYN